MKITRIIFIALFFALINMIYYFCDKTDFAWVRSENRRKRFGTFCENSWLNANLMAFGTLCIFFAYDHVANKDSIFNAI